MNNKTVPLNVLISQELSTRLQDVRNKSAAVETSLRQFLSLPAIEAPRRGRPRKIREAGDPGGNEGK